MIFDDLEAYGTSTAIVTESGESMTFLELVRRADEMTENIQERSLVFFLCRNDVSSIAGYVGVLRRRAIPLLLRGDIQDEHLSNLMEAYHPQYLWLEGEAKKELGGKVLYSDGMYSLVATGEQTYPVHEELAVLLSTSGSTGSPKFVRQSYRNIEANTKSIIEYLSLDVDDRAITTMPMYYTYGLSIIQSQLCSGGSLAVTDASILEPRFWDFLKTSKATNFGGVPYTYEMLKRMRFARMELPDLRFITQAGGKLAASLSLEFAKICEEKGLAFITMYGACEATARMSYLPWAHAQDKAGSIGIAIPGGRFAIERAEGGVVEEDGVEGELLYYGDNVTLGYAESWQDLVKGDERKGVLHTGDIAYRDEDGYYYITGRKKRFLKLFGNRVSLDAVEAFLKSKGYLSCVCSGTDERLIVYTTEAMDRKAMCAMLGKFTKLHTSAFSVVQVREIPRNEAGKVLYNQMNSMVGGE